MIDMRAEWKALSRRGRTRVILGLFGIVFMILYAVFVALFTQPLSDLSPHYRIQPSNDAEAGR